MARSQLTGSQADRAGHEGPREDCRWSHKTGGVYCTSQFGFVPGRGTKDAIFVIRQLQEKYLQVKRRLYMAFVDLEKAFDHVPRKVIR